MASIFYVFKIVEQEVEILSLRRDAKYTATYCALENMSQSTCALLLVCAELESSKYECRLKAMFCIAYGYPASMASR